jgi:hypothetical protein
MSMRLIGENGARPTVWLLEAEVEHSGQRYAFAYEYDDRDGDSSYEFTADEPDDDFDFDEFRCRCQARVEADALPMLRLLNRGTPRDTRILESAA